MSAIFLIVLVDILGLTIILPLLPFYAEHFGASATTVGLLISSYALCQLIAAPLLGRLSDSRGRKPLLLLSQAGTFAGFLILAGAGSLWMVFLGRIIDGLTAGNLSLAQAYISDITTPQNRAKAFGLIGTAFGIGFLIGPAISGYLAQFGYAYPILTAAALSATSILCTLFLLPAEKPHETTQQPPGSFLGFFAKPGLRGLLIQFLLYTFSFTIFMSGFALYAQRRYQYETREVGYVLAFIGLLGIVHQGGLLGPLRRWIGERGLVITGFLATTAAYGILGWSTTRLQLLGSSAANAYGNGSLRPALTSLITQRAERSEQGAVIGLTQSMTAISQIVAPLISGTLIDHGFLLPWAIAAAAIAFLGLFIR